MLSKGLPCPLHPRRFTHTHENTRVHCWAAPRGLKGLGFPSFKTEERAWSQQQRQLFHGRGSLHVGGKVLK